MRFYRFVMRDQVWAELGSDLDDLRTRHLYRSPEIFPSKTPLKKLGRFIDFSSNDYLGLSQHPEVVRRSASALSRWGTGSGASRLLSGNLKIHLDLEKKLARFKKEESSVVFSSGYLANLGAVRTLVGEKDVVILDRLCHASLVDGARLSRAKFWVYEHRSAAHLEKVLARAKGFRRRLVVTDAYFSMDGDVAPIPELLALCRRHDAVLLVDEAHSTGVYGKNGRGLSEHFGVEGRIPVVTGTLSKALGSVGGFVAGCRELTESIVNFCRPYIYTTAPSPASSAAVLGAIEVLTESSKPREKLWENTRFAREGLSALGLDLMGSEGPIIPIRVGDPSKTMALKESLKASGIFVSAIRPPSVPKGTERIRLSISAAHSRAQITHLTACLKRSRKYLS